MITLEKIIPHCEQIWKLAQQFGYQDVRFCPLDFPNLEDSVCFITKWASLNTVSPYNEGLFQEELEKLLKSKVEIFSEEGILENTDSEWTKEVMVPALEQAISLKEINMKSQAALESKLTSKSLLFSPFDATSNTEPEIKLDKEHQTLMVPYSVLEISETQLENKQVRAMLLENLKETARLISRLSISSES